MQCVFSQMWNLDRKTYIYIYMKKIEMKLLWPGERCLQGKRGKKERTVAEREGQTCMLSLIPQL